MKESFDAYIGTLPASEIDIDSIARRGRRTRRRRSAATIGITAIALIASGGFVTTQLRTVAPTHAPDLPPAVQASASQTPSTFMPTSAEADRLLTALQAAIQKHAPQVRGVQSLVRYVEKGPNGGTRVPAGPGEFTRHCHRVPPKPIQSPAGQQSAITPTPAATTVCTWDSYIWQGTVTSGTGTYTLQIFIRPGAYLDPDSPVSDDIDARERQAAVEQGTAPVRGPHGESIIASNYQINTTKPDGTSILISAFDTNTDGAYMTRSPFTSDQLVAITLESDLHLHP